ncbi:MAG: thiol:disulfide interchange protein DsbA/DsbL [Betaproteobacteria bacterium]
MKTMLWIARSAAALTLISFGALSMAADLEEGKDYRRLAKPQATETGKKIEVIEFFSFSCPHCKDMEPFLSEWIKKLPADVQVRRIPAQFSPPWVGTAKVWYTLEGLNEEKLAPAAFNAIHGQNVRLDQDKPFFDWSATQGLDRKKVEDMYNSFAVNGKVARAKTLVQNYGVQSVPTFVVDGKYTTETGTSKQHADIPALLDKLIDKARAEHGK